MKKRRILVIALSLVLFVGLAICASLSVFADSAVTESSWIAAPKKALVKCAGEGCDHKECDYVYSFAVIGDTQNLNIYDVNNKTEHMKGLYNWILANKDSKNIQYVMGLGDITQAYYRGYQSGVWEEEWVNAKEAISLLDGKIPYSLVRGNHDITAGFNGAFGVGNKYYTDLAALAATKDSVDENGRPMAGFLNADKIEDTYRKVIIGDHKYIIFTLDWHPTEECLTWVDTVLAENSDYQAIITIHSFITRDGTITDDYEDTFPYENLTGTRPNWEEVSASGGNVFPKVLWESVLSKHKNVEMILCGHIDEDDIITTQLEGENGNTVTAMLINPQTIDSTVEPVGMVAMFYISADGKVMNVEYVSTVREAANKNAYLGNQNQFEVRLDYTVSETNNGWTETPHGSILTEIYNAYPFHVLMDDDSDESTDAFLFGSYSSWEETLKAIHDFCGNSRPSSHKKMKTYYVVMSKDYTDTYVGIHDNRAAYNLGKTVLDLNGKTLTLASTDGVFLPFYVTSSGKYPKFTITNGNIDITGKVKLVALQSGSAAQGETGTLELSDLNITYSSTATATPLITTYNGSGTGSYVDFKISNCNIDSSAVNGAMTLFGLNDTNNNNHVALNITGGSIKGSTSADTTVFALNNLSDKVTFTKDLGGNYTTLTFADNASFDGVFYSDVKDTYLEFGAPVANGDSYVYSLEKSGAVLTDYGIIPESATSYPFVLFKNGEMIHTSSDWNTLINTDFKGTANYQSGCTLLLRKDYSTSSSTGSPSWFARIDDLTIDLGGNTFTRGSYHMFQLMGTESTAHSTSFRIINGTIATGSSTAPVVFNNADSNTNTDTFDVTFDGVKFDLSASVTGSQGILVCFGDGIEKGVDANITLNDCTIYRGSSTRKMTLFALIDEKEGKVNNKTDVNVVINGGELVADTMSGITLATYSPAREGMTASADSLSLGKGSDGKYLIAKLPASYTVPTTTYALLDGNYAVGKDSDDGTTAYCSFNKLTTPYGDVSAKYASIVNYPFAVFYNGAFVEAFGSYNKAIGKAVALIDTDAEVAICDTAYVVLRSNFVATDNGYFSGARGKLIVDLQGYTISSSTAALASISWNYNSITDEAAVEKYLSYTSNITFKNGTIKNDRSGLPIIAIDQTNGSATTVPSATAKKLYYGFENVTFRTASQPILHNYDKTTSHGLEVTVFAKNCTFDFTGATEGVAMISLFNKLVKANIELVGCDVIASKLDSFNVYKIGSDDTAKITKGDNGVYMTVTQSTEALPTTVYNLSDGGSASFYLTSSAGGKYVYDLGADEFIDGYGTIPAQYTNKETYPVILFDNGSATGYTTIANAYAALSATGDYTILIRRDVIKDSNKGLSTFRGNLTIDLDGHTLTVTLGGNYLIDITLSDVGAGASASFSFKNGTLKKEGGRGHILYNYNASLNGSANYRFDFDSVTFVSTDSTYTPNVVFNTWENGFDNATVAASDYKLVANSTFTDCVFDFASSIDGAVMLPLNHSSNTKDRVVHNVTVNGGVVLADSASDFADRFVKLDGNTNGRADSITFAKANGGNYTALVLPSGTEAPTAEYNGLVFVKISDNETNVTYRLRPAEFADLNYAPKMSLTLDRNLVLNVYIPVNCTQEFTLDGVKYTDFTAFDGKTVEFEGAMYYLVSVELSAKEAARIVALEATVKVDDKTATATFTFSTVTYAEKLLSDSAITQTEKTLVKDVLQYIRAAYTYFGTEDAEQMAKINTLLGDYVSKPTVEGSDASDTTGMKSATLVLSGKPSIRFYLADGANASAYKFYVGGKEVNTIVSDDGTYVDIDAYAYALCETVTYTIDGNDAGSFHINAYYAFVSGAGENSYTGADKAELTALTECFWKYLQSARAYRESVVEN
ncbi:MAG: metallophosphoesterase [Clostridia bacterium]|nr:metallophosphoesterase [Clostridia bacterium]